MSYQMLKHGIQKCEQALHIVIFFQFKTEWKENFKLFFSVWF